MSKTSTTGYYVRSKNAGPFWLTIDIFCDGPEVFNQLRDEPRLCAAAVANLLKTTPEGVKIFHLDRLNVIKISLPRPVVQGSISDRDMHGAQWSCLLQAELEGKPGRQSEHSIAD